MRRFWLDPLEFENNQLKVSGELFHHIVDVCRFAKGDQFELLNTGRAFLVEVIEITRRDLTVQMIEPRTVKGPSLPRIHVVLSIPRPAKVDWIVEKLVELGVHALYPVVSDFSFVRKVSELPAAKTERWQKLVRQAAQQSARADLMQIHAVTTLFERVQAINRSREVACLFPYEGDCPVTLKQQLSQLERGAIHDLWVIIGSEGGFSRPEVERFQQLGIQPVTLGEQILRVETACVALASILKYEFGG